MRFDDRLSTLLASKPSSSIARDAMWSQLVDLLAQGAAAEDHAFLEDTALALASRVRPERRLASAKSVGPRCHSVDLVRIFGSDEARIAAPVLLGAHLTASEWCEVIPALPSRARNLLRQRRDLSREARDALGRFGHSDFAIEPPPAPAPIIEEKTDNTQIRDLMARIANWREKREVAAEAPPSQPAAEVGFRLETDAEGIVIWTDWSGRAALIGLKLGDQQHMRDYGFDADATSAYARRIMFRHARLTLSDRRVWSVAGDPVFRAGDNAFLGYRCVARPLEAEEAADLATPPSADAFRQLAHELRTPLNAVQGFAAMIESQLLGPVGESYRQRASQIERDVARVLEVIQDAESWSRRSGEGEQTADLAAVVAKVSEGCQVLERERGATLHFRVNANLSPVAIDTASATRLVHALTRAVLSSAAPGERLCADVGADFAAMLALKKSAALAQATSADLVSGNLTLGSDDEDMLPLGTGFMLRMVATQARAVGGSLDCHGDALTLRLPIAHDSAAGVSERR